MLILDGRRAAAAGRRGPGRARGAGRSRGRDRDRPADARLRPSRPGHPGRRRPTSCASGRGSLAGREGRFVEAIGPRRFAGRVHLEAGLVRLPDGTIAAVPLGDLERYLSGARARRTGRARRAFGYARGRCPPRPRSNAIDCPDPAATSALGRALAAAARPGDLICLWGELGRRQDPPGQGVRGRARRDRHHHLAELHPDGRVRRPAAALPPRPVPPRRRDRRAGRRADRRPPVGRGHARRVARSPRAGAAAERLDVVIDGTGDDPRAITCGRARAICAGTSRRSDEPARGSPDPRRRRGRVGRSSPSIRDHAGSSSPPATSTGGADRRAMDWPAGYRHGETLLPSIDAFLARRRSRRSRSRRSRWAPGPGAFTGLRVGIATAKGLAHGLGLPIVGVSTGGRAAGRLARRARVLLLPAGPARPALVRSDGDAGARCCRPAWSRTWRPTRSLVAVDLPDRAPADGAGPRRGRPGEARRDAWSGSGAARLAAGDVDDLAAARARVRDPAARRPGGGRGGVVVARPPLRLRIEPMQIDDLPAVHAIERASFDAPWPPDAYRNELETNRLAKYLVARVGDEIAAFGGMWLMVDEGHIITFAVHPDWRRQRIGERLLLAFLDLATERRRARGDARGPPVQPAGPPAVREVRLPARRAPAALLQRQRRGRPDHDHRPAARAADARADSPGCGPRSTRRRPRTLRPPTASRDVSRRR